MNVTENARKLLEYFTKTNNYIGLPFQFRPSTVLYCSLNEKELDLLAHIRKWVIDQKPSKVTSTHWWHKSTDVKQIPKDIELAFDKIALCNTITDMFYERFGKNISIDVLYDMNEIYVSAPTNVKRTSDEVFYTRHIDGPYYYFPFASCYRMIIAMDQNKEIMTVFDMVSLEIALSTGEALAFDFHRECHHIKKIEGINNHDFRVVLKIHYCIYPKIISSFGKVLGHLSIQYNKAFRNMFLMTIKPKTVYERLLACNVIICTKIVYAIEAYFGYSNIAYIVLLWYLGQTYGLNIYIIGTSFVHHVRYLTTNYWRRNCAYGQFLRDMVLYKILSFVNIIYLYIYYYHDVSSLRDIDYLGLIGILFGHMFSIYYTLLLGLSRTFLGEECGYLVNNHHDKIIRKNIYIYEIWALTAYHNNVTFYYNFPYLIPMHIIFYIVILLQEGY